MKKIVSSKATINPENEVIDINLTLDDKHFGFYKLTLDTEDGPLYQIVLRKIEKSDLKKLQTYIQNILKEEVSK